MQEKLTPASLATWEVEIRRMPVQSQPWTSSSQDPILKVPITKRAGGEAQVAQYLPSKHETLCSNPSTVKKKKKTKFNILS
jgi:hypothetical protein